MVAVGAVLGYSFFERGGTKPPESAPLRAPAEAPTPDLPATEAETAPAAINAAADAEMPPETSVDENELYTLAGNDVARWIADVESPDPRSRANAIAALAKAPKEEAVPVLSHVLETGEPQVDRHIALRSLHAIALEQGDDDGGIRQALRGAIYHGDDDSVSENAQALLDDIEAAIAEQTN